MRIAYFFTVCAYLSSTVSTDEIELLSRINRNNLREELALRDVSRREISPAVKVLHPDVLFALQNSQLKARLDGVQRPRRAREAQQIGPQQHRHSRDRLKPSRQLKRLKTRSIGGAIELDDNQLNELSKPAVEAHDDGGSIHIKPVLRVTTKKSVFDSIVDIVRQLLNPPKNEKGPLVGPIKIPGSPRKVYLRLLEPVESSHVMVRFVTQVPVPVIDVEEKHSHMGIPIIDRPIVDPATVLLLGSHHHGVLSGDAVYGSSNRHHTIQPLRNNSQAFGKARGPPTAKSVSPTPKSLPNDLRDGDASVKGGLSPVKETPPDKFQSNKNPFEQLNQENQRNVDKYVGGTDSYYRYQTDENAAKESLNDSATTAIGSDGTSKGPGWEYQLSTHRLPLRQIAPLYPLTSMGQSESSAYAADTYKAPNSDVPIGSYSTPYNERYNGANAATGYYGNNYASAFPGQHYGAPSAHSTSYAKPSDVRTTLLPSQTGIHSTPSYQNGFYPGSVPSSHSTSTYGRYDNINGASSSTANYYRDGTGPDDGSTRVAASSNDALRVIDPPYLSSYRRPAPSDDYANRSYERPLIASIRERSRYATRDLDQAGSMSAQWNDVILDDATRERGESSVGKSADDIASQAIIDHERWQPIAFDHEDDRASWSQAYADLTRVAATVASGEARVPRQPFDRTRSKANERTNDRRRGGGKRQSAAAIVREGAKCSTADEENGCEAETRITSAPVPSRSERPVKIVENWTQQSTTSRTAQISSAVHAVVPLEKSVATKNPTRSITTERPSPPLPSPSSLKTIESPATSGTTVRSPLLIKAIESFVLNDATEQLAKKAADKLTDKSAGKATGKQVGKPANKLAGKATSKLRESSLEAATGATDEPAIGSTTESAPVSSSTTKKSTLPRRPMIMKKPTYIMKRLEPSSTTRRTTHRRTTTTSTTTKRPATTRKSTFRTAFARTKSST